MSSAGVGARQKVDAAQEWRLIASSKYTKGPVHKLHNIRSERGREGELNFCWPAYS